MPDSKMHCRLPAIDPWLPRLWPVLRRKRETHDTFTLEFEKQNGYEFRPGQFNMLYVPGYGEVPISVSSDPNEPQVLHTIRAVGAVTRALSRLGTGDVVGVRGPYGQAWPDVDAETKDVVIVAGGIGLAPLRPILYRMLATRAPATRLHLVYGARTPGDLLYTAEWKRWNQRRGVDCHVTVDQGDEAWQGTTGVVTKLIARLDLAAERSLALLCGPEVMMRFAARELQQKGLLASSIHVSLERNMKCATGVCGHCQLGPVFVCKDGPVFSLSQANPLMSVHEL